MSNSVSKRHATATAAQTGLSVAKHFISAARIYLVPLNLKEIATSIAIQQTLHIGLGLMMYPSTEEMLIRLGLNEQTANQIAPWNPSFVVPAGQDKNYLDLAYSSTSFPTIVGAVIGVYAGSQSTNGYAVPLFSCTITLPNEDRYDLKNKISSEMLVPSDKVVINNLTAQEELLTVLLHEIGHCNTGTVAIGATMPYAISGMEALGITPAPFKEFSMHHQLRKELSADEYSLDIVTAHIDHIAHEMSLLRLYRRATPFHFLIDSNSHHDYDLALSVDAHIRNIPKPSTQEIVASREEISSFVRSRYLERVPNAKLENNMLDNIRDYFTNLIDISSEDFVPQNNKAAIFYILTVDQFLQQPDITPLAKRRAELYLESMTYFAPEVVQSARAEAKEQALQMPASSEPAPAP
jgi:hypothetical protein